MKRLLIAILILMMFVMSCSPTYPAYDGETAQETAQNIVKRYHETHVYSKYDFFVCSDMALDVWNMLKAQGIDAAIQIGNVETGAEDITEAEHVWVLAEVSPGKYLALETTGGYAVWKTDDPLYYEGWSFDNPREYKRFVEIRHEYDFRASLVKQLGETYEASRLALVEAAAEYEKLAAEVEGMSVYDSSFSLKLVQLVEKAIECGKYLGRCEQLAEMINEQSQQVESMLSEMKGLLQ